MTDSNITDALTYLQQIAAALGGNPATIDVSTDTKAVQSCIAVMNVILGQCGLPTVTDTSTNELTAMGLFGSQIVRWATVFV